MAEDVKVSGPLFDGRAEATLREGVEAARHAVAMRGKALTAAAFAAAIRDNHGRFVASVDIVTSSRTITTASGHRSYTMPVDVPTDCDVVTTDIASYGPWLEGVGSRNDSTRFKGYFGFRRAAEELDRVAGEVAKDAIAPYVQRMS